MANISISGMTDIVSISNNDIFPLSKYISPGVYSLTPYKVSFLELLTGVGKVNNDNGFSLTGGNVNPYTLTIEGNSDINQSLSMESSVTFNDLTLTGTDSFLNIDGNINVSDGDISIATGGKISTDIINEFTTNNGITFNSNLLINEKIQFSPVLNNRKIILYSSTNNDNEFYGFGIGGSTLRYQVENTSSNHTFYCGINQFTSDELFSIKGTKQIINSCDEWIQAKQIFFRSYPDNYHGVSYFGLDISRLFQGYDVNGPVLFGFENVGLGINNSFGEFLFFRVNRDGFVSQSLLPSPTPDANIRNKEAIFYSDGITFNVKGKKSDGTVYTFDLSTNSGGDVTGGNLSENQELVAYSNTTGKSIGRSYSGVSGTPVLKTGGSGYTQILYNISTGTLGQNPIVGYRIQTAQYDGSPGISTARWCIDGLFNNATTDNHSLAMGRDDGKYYFQMFRKGQIGIGLNLTYDNQEVDTLSFKTYGNIKFSGSNNITYLENTASSSNKKIYGFKVEDGYFSINSYKDDFTQTQLVDIRWDGNNVGAYNIYGSSLELPNTDLARKTTTTLWTVISDSRLKNDFGLLSSKEAIETIMNIPIHVFTFKDEICKAKNISNKKRIGMFAQEVQKIYPNAIEKINNGIIENQLEMNNNDFLFMMHRMLQSHEKRLKKLEKLQ